MFSVNFRCFPIYCQYFDSNEFDICIPSLCIVANYEHVELRIFGCCSKSNYPKFPKSSPLRELSTFMLVV